MKGNLFFDELQIMADYTILDITNFIKLNYKNLSVMINRVEKLSLLSEMIAFAQTDENIKSIEYKFLIGVAKQLEISEEDFDYLFKYPVTYIHLKSHSERIVQFHRLVLLMNLDSNITNKELVKLHNFGLRMGLSHESINRVLDLMESFPNKVVPPDFLIDIFKVQYN
jgi:hypothetical protein